MSETVVLPTGLPSHIRPGLIIAGRYRLEQEIGRGSMGTVYRAVHVTLGQRVAIKLISAEHLQSSEARHRFSVEAKAAAKLRSRHVVQVYDDGETPEGNPYIVLEYLEGETLEQRLERDHDIPLVDAVRIATHVGRALARAHAQGIVHRDLKPANIFLVRTEDDEEHGWIAKVLDFGIAKLDTQGEKSTTQAGTVLGTPLFMSPEQVRGASSVDHRADLYSLGICLYTMLSGDLPFYSQNYGEILVAICTEPLPLLRTSAPWVPDAVELWFQRACAKDPMDRFQSADEMTEALAAAAGPPAARSKHKSVPEGRIAPETLMGYAPPAISPFLPGADTVNSSGPASLARTQQLAPATARVSATGTSDGHASPESGYASAPIPIVVPSERRGGDSLSQTALRELIPRSRGFAPLLIGAAFGLLSVLAVAVTLLVVGKAAEKEPAPSPAASTPGASAPSNVAVERAAAPEPHVTATPPPAAPAPPAAANADAVPPPLSSAESASSGSSGTASGAALATPRPTKKAVSPRPAAPKAPARPAAPAAPGPTKSPSSDLGF